jgi:hypothetical protein
MVSGNLFSKTKDKKLNIKIKADLVNRKETLQVY